MTSVHDVCAAILKLTPAERYRLAAHLFDRNETALAHVVVRAGIVDEPVSDDLDELTGASPVFALELT